MYLYRVGIDMPHHDYDLPTDWHTFTPEEKSRWMTQERCRRQALQQQTGYQKRVTDRARRRARKEKAHPATVPAEEYR